VKILVRYDVDGWAFYRRARGLQRAASNTHEVVLRSTQAFTLKKELKRGYGAVLLCSMNQDWPDGTGARVVRFVGSHAWLYPEYDPADWRTKGVIKDSRSQPMAAKILPKCHAVGVHNREQQVGLRQFNPHIEIMPYCVDQQVFRPKDRRGPSGKLRIGWCGQLGGGFGSFKGLTELLLPVVAKLGELVVWRVNHGDHRYGLRAEELVDWYNGIDLFLCTSVAEGGPQPPFEAAACGAAVLSTDVGQVSDWRGLREMGMVVPGYRTEAEALRTAEVIAGKIEMLDRNRGRLKELQREAQASVERHYDAAVEYPGHLDFIAGRTLLSELGGKK
jgi:glycosyltransferase involved in cell wall biosynthesis